MKILVATPVYDWGVPVHTVRSLLNEKTASTILGDEILVEFLPGCSHPAQGRNQLAKTFMESDCERLVFLDSDITWNVGSLLKIAHYPVDFCGGVYRFKMPEESYPLGWLQENKELRASELGLLEVAALPTGFMSLSRNVFETIRAKCPERNFVHFGKEMFAYFEMPYKAGHLYGEDGTFCALWRSLGGKVWLDPEISLTHWDMRPTPYPGHIGNWLKGRNKEKKNETDSLSVLEIPQGPQAEIDP